MVRDQVVGEKELHLQVIYIIWKIQGAKNQAGEFLMRAIGIDFPCSVCELPEAGGGSIAQQVKVLPEAIFNSVSRLFFGRIDNGVTSEVAYPESVRNNITDFECGVYGKRERLGENIFARCTHREAKAAFGVAGSCI